MSPRVRLATIVGASVGIWAGLMMVVEGVKHMITGHR